MQHLDNLLNKAVANNDLPFVVAMVGTAAGVSYGGAAGPGAGPDTVFRVFSFSKAIGAMAAMILIERGKLSLDSRVVDILPEFGNLQVLEGFDGGRPRLRAPKVQATVRHLAWAARVGESRESGSGTLHRIVAPGRRKACGSSWR